MHSLFEKDGNYYIVSKNSLEYWDYACCYKIIAEGTKKELEKLLEGDMEEVPKRWKAA